VFQHISFFLQRVSWKVEVLEPLSDFLELVFIKLSEHFVQKRTVNKPWAVLLVIAPPELLNDRVLQVFLHDGMFGGVKSGLIHRLGEWIFA